MRITDFEFDGKRLSEYGMIVCSFGNKGLETVSDGSTITFNTVSSLNGSVNRLTSTTYEDCLGATIQICKHSCTNGVQKITPIEHRELVKWLNRKQFLKFKPLSEDYMGLYCEASFNISRIELDGELYGFELEIVTNRPFLLREPKIIKIKNTTKDGKHSINDLSHEEGYIYPRTEITIGNIDDIPEKDRNLNIYNAIEDRDTYIAGVSTGEVITMDYPIIESSISSHNIQNDFNWNFFRVANTFRNSRNDLTISIPCTIEIKYSPIVKVGL